MTKKKNNNNNHAPKLDFFTSTLYNQYNGNNLIKIMTTLFFSQLNHFEI